MKLRNKKTGEVVEWDGVRITTDNDDGETFGSIAELNENWEDYKPIEPLIKDEKNRNAVRAWADANGINKLLVIKTTGRLEISDGSPHLIYISFHAGKETMDNLNDRTYYAIAELCGEEEE